MDKAKPIDELISSLRKINSIADEKYNNSTFTKDTTSSNKSQKSGGLGVEFAVLMALNLLHEFAGFRVTDHLEHKIKHIFRNSSQEELQAWIHHMERDSSKADLISLVEDLANHETYFFRDMNQLDIISNKLLPEMLKAKFHAVDSKVKIWSAACSTGEEAYTLAMLLSDALLDARVGYSGKPGEIFFPTNWEIEVLGS
ncbi:MAG TPA: CheR family methyltransferase, partial [Pseudomonadales bacterium]